MLFILVQVICGVKLLRPWYGRIVPESITIADLFDMVQTGSFDSGPPIINSLLDENDDHDSQDEKKMLASNPTQ